MEVYAQDKWKLPKKESRSRRPMAEGTAASASAAAAAAGPSFLKSSASTRESRRTTTSTPPAPETMPRSFSSRCSSLVKEQRARFYIVRRCVTMLVCWRDYS